MLPVTGSTPNVSAVKGYEIFAELSHVMELQKLSHLMEQEMVNRFQILQELGGANDGLASASSDRPTSQTSKEDSTEEQEQDVEAGEREPFLVLRPDLIVPELRDLPALRDMLTVPTTLTEALRLVFALRKDMLVLRNGVLKQALAKAEEQIEMRRKPPPVVDNKQERLLTELSKVFSRAQLAFLRDGGKTEPWTLEDYLQSISLRMICRHSTFEYVTNVMNIPLPSMHSVRSMASCGLMPEVTKRYKELAEAKDLRFGRHATSVKRPQFADIVAESDGTEYRSLGAHKPVKQATPRGARRVSKRKRTESDEELEPMQPSPRRAYWDATGLELETEQNWSDGESESESSNQGHQLLRAPQQAQDRARGRGRNRSGNQQWAGGEPGPGETVDAEFISLIETDTEYLSEDQHDQVDVDFVSSAREVPGHLSQMRDFVEPDSAGDSAGRDWHATMRPPQADWESPPQRSPKKKGRKKRSSQRGRMMQT